jgi:pimeloyl-ACP methyl ester carboxylesterase
MAISDDQIRNVLANYAKLGPEAPPVHSALGELRRGRRRPPHRPSSQVSLTVRDDGLAIWDWGFESRLRRASSPRARRAGRRTAGAEPGGREIFTQILKPIGVNQIGEMLLDFDVARNSKFDRKAGWKLRQWYPEKQQLGDAQPAEAKNILVIVHGTASCADHIVSEILLAPTGGKLLADAAKHYSAVLAFEHPTISMSPVLNALDLAAAVAPYGTCSVDIVCHSRGGLVASWWMHVVDSRPREKRCVFVGSPLQGTNLANPAKLRSSLHLLASYGRALGTVSVAEGFLALPMTIIKVASSVVDFTSKTPLLDAALAMIPGLGAQSAIGNNQELLRLNARKLPGQNAPAHFYIRSNYASPGVGWKFWRYFTDHPELRLADAAVDAFVFPGNNDLVVDTDSMLDAMEGPEYRFPDGKGVHHTSYFEQDETVGKIREWLGIAG